MTDLLPTKMALASVRERAFQEREAPDWALDDGVQWGHSFSVSVSLVDDPSEPAVDVNIGLRFALAKDGTEKSQATPWVITSGSFICRFGVMFDEEASGDSDCRRVITIPVLINLVAISFSTSRGYLLGRSSKEPRPHPLIDNAQIEELLREALGEHEALCFD
jgi:hypothetical protein